MGVVTKFCSFTNLQNIIHHMEIPLVSTTLRKEQGSYSERTGQDFHTFVRAYRKIICGQAAASRALWGSLAYLATGMGMMALYTKYYKTPTRLPTKGLVLGCFYSFGFYVHLERGYIICAQSKASEDVVGVWKKLEKDENSLV